MSTSTHPRGVTIFEVLISMAVFSIITAIVLFGFVDGRRVQDLRQASGQVVADLRQIQTLTFANNSVPVCSSTGPGTSFGTPCTTVAVCGGAANSCGLVPAGGYGVILNTCTSAFCTYQIYGDIGDGQLTAGVPGPPDGSRSVGPNFSDPIVSTTTLPGKISIMSIKVTNASGVVTEVPNFTVNVVPPRPVTRFSPTGVSVSVCLEHQQSHLRRLVTMVAASGQVSERSVSVCP
jgi:prepilin-type N-terminal cleavage/methylation domain-containing protein